MAEYVRHVQDVRKAVLHSLSAAPCSLPEILDRTRDIDDEVRHLNSSTGHHHFPPSIQPFQDPRICGSRRRRLSNAELHAL